MTQTRNLSILADSVNSSGVLGVAGGGTGVTTSTGTGNVVLSSSPTLTTPSLGVATVTSVNGLAITATTGTLTIPASTIAFAGAFPTTITTTGTTSVTLPTSGTLATTAGSVASFRTTLSGLTPTAATTGAITLAGTLGVTGGGTGTNTAFTAGSVVFAGAGGVYSQNNSNLFWDNANGRLGVGTSSPNYKLTVNGDAAFGGGATSGVITSTGASGTYGGVNLLLNGRTSGNDSAIYFRSNDGLTNYGFLSSTSTDLNLYSVGVPLALNTSGAQPMTFLTNSSEAMRITSAGNVGIGTSSPGTKLDVTGTSRVTGNFYVTGNSSIGPFTGAYTNSSLTITPTANPTTIAESNQLTIGEVTHNPTFKLSIGYLNISGGFRGTIQSYDNGSANALLINPSGGNVGIGTTSPGSPLDVVGNINASYISTSSSTSTTPTLSYNASNTSVAKGVTVSGSYVQDVIQNKSATAGASANYVVSPDNGTDSTYYGEFGINSSVFSASTPADFFSLNNQTYFSSHDGDVAVGSGNGYKTYFPWGATAGSAHVINASGAWGFSTNLGTTLANSGTIGYGTSGQALITAGSGAAPAWGTLGVAGGGTGVTTSTGTGSVVLSSSPTLTAPSLGVATATSLNGLRVTTTTGTLTIPSATIAFSGADNATFTTTGVTTLTLPTSGTLATTGGTVASFSAGTTGLTPATATTGTVTLGGTLAVASGGTGTNTAFTQGSVVFAGAGGVYSQNNSNLFWDNANGRLGVGTSSPNYKLTVNGDAAFGGGTTSGVLTSTGGSGVDGGVNLLLNGRSADNNSGIYFRSNSGAVNYGVLSSTSTQLSLYSAVTLSLSTSSAQPMTFLTNSSEAMRITSAGNVGIGTSSPETKLDVTGTSRVTGNFYVTGNSSIGPFTGAYTNSSLTITPTANPTTIAESNQLTIGEVTHNPAFKLSIGYLNISGGFRGTIQSYDNGSANALLINPSGGNVGIGTTAPAYPLDVNGTIQATGLVVSGPAAFKSPTTVAAATYTQLTTDSTLDVTVTALTLTLLAAATYPGQVLYIRASTATTAITSASSNVVPFGTTTAGIAIMVLGGKFTVLQSNGTNWLVIAQG